MASSGSVCSAERSQLQDSSESDSETEGGPARPAGVEPSPGSFARIQVIHSGHFMVSSPHSDSAARRRKSGGSLRYDFDTVNRTWCQTYRYHSGSLSIDPTLTRLFECMSLAYSGKIVSPKWKSFKGLRLLWRDKIRLNNAIWRAWFIQYVEKRKNPVCGFVTPLEGSEAEAHRKPEAIILEGSYWKRRIEVVIKEYHKWRIYYKKRLQKKKDDILSMLQEGQTCQAKLDRWSSHSYQEPEVAPVEAHMFDLDCLLSDISDTLFTMTQKPCPWTSDLHNTYTSNADMIQPGLTPLQPSMDDFMDIPDIFLNYRGQPTDQSGYADCSYFETTPSTIYAPVPSPVETAPQLLIDTQLAQPSRSSDSLPQPSTSSPRSEQTRVSQDCGEYHTSSLGSEAMPYGHQSYHDASVSSAYTEQVAVSAVRGKHKQKTGGMRTVGSPALPSNPQSTAPVPTSCLAKLLSSSTHEKKPTLGFNSATPITTKGQRSTSKSSVKSCAVQQTSRVAQVGGVSSTLQRGTGWPTVMTPLLGHSGPHASSLKGSGVSALLTHGSTNSTTALLIPKTEKLSPVPHFSTDRSSLTVQFTARPGQISPPNPLDKASNPESPQSGFLGQGKLESTKQTETRRITHISAEQKRRFNIKLGFDTLHNLVTTLSSQPSIKISKATTLQKTAEYISKMQQERAQLHEEVQRLREEIQHLNSSINACQQQLPATGVPITRQRFDYMRQKFREYVRAQTLQNWKFWIFSIIIEPLFESYNGMVSTASVEDLCRSTLSWLDQHCALPALRPMVLSSLRLLSTTTAILTDPSLLPEQAAFAVTQGDPAPAVDHSLQPITRQ
ncbi:carbohydrate-responsive element-binding protein-like isoform X4 [Girardinichthys multiradiatus]|uniref:carbohydrate-responsive element-binding protein-like isoform X4 n=1 Tax=Girardinichthys multiradiatus TaxID=208333 RepID=UPI001FABC635|nr:carbohydrate-responsive element-binding protein-like isoform X4 [Girardinichthys multiradiatus]